MYIYIYIWYYLYNITRIHHENAKSLYTNSTAFELDRVLIKE